MNKIILLLAFWLLPAFAVAAPLKLNCDIRDGVQQGEVNLTVDMVNQTVNDRPAHISDDFIEWDGVTTRSEKAHFLINRSNGSFSMEVQGKITNIQGICTELSPPNRSTVLPDEITLQTFTGGADGKERLIINFRGRISDDGFLQALQREIDPLKQKPIVIVNINSPGGDWNASLALGRYLRKIEAYVNVMGDCYSSCVLILAAGVRRMIMPESSVGIHRPYSTDVRPKTFSEAERRYRALEAETKKYLRDMNMPEALFEAMVRVPPESTRELTAIELERFGLSQDDPAAQEVDNAKEAKKYGLTMVEYLRRKARREKVCKAELLNSTTDDSRTIIKSWLDCQEAVMQGVR